MAQENQRTAHAETVNAYRTKVSQLQQDYAWAVVMRDDAIQALGKMALDYAAEKQHREELAAVYESLNDYHYIGECTVTAYCPCADCCGRWADGKTATGLELAPGMCAVDPAVIPLGSTVIVDGLCYLAADTGVTGNCVDVAFLDHKQAEQFGVQTMAVWIKNEERGYSECPRGN